LHLSGARLIWRKGVGGNPLADGHAPFAAQPPSIQTGGGSAALYRAAAAASSETRVMRDEGGGGGEVVGPAPSNAGQINLEQITEHVSRVLLRRVSVERERRGVGRWL
jgi:hypothetical protein